jgi:hypothetical protein
MFIYSRCNFNIFVADEHQSLSFPGSHAHKKNTDLCQDIYIKSCRHFGTVPSTYFFRRLRRTHIDMSHHGVGTIGIKSIAIALVVGFCLFDIIIRIIWGWGGVGVMVFNATLNNISVISWLPVLLVEETGVPGENHRPACRIICTVECGCYLQTDGRCVSI